MTIRTIYAFTAVLLGSGLQLRAAPSKTAAPPDLKLIPPAYQSSANRLISEALGSRLAFDRLAELCDTFGPRFTGSTNLEAAIDWSLTELKKDGFQNVRGEKVMAPHWVRGKESVEMMEPRRQILPMLGLGGSVGTPPEGVTAPVLVVKDFAELQERRKDARGRIVVFNTPFTEYRETVKIRYQGADEASAAGAVASLIRSVGPFSMQTPHTGGMRYSGEQRKIPHAAITIEYAEMLQRMQDRGVTPVLRVKMEALNLPDTLTRNVVAEIPGREHPEQVIVSGHIDSWDVGTGAMDDGGGCLAAWEAARLMLKLGLRPRRTVRLVLWTNEENGMLGARTYRRDHDAELGNHLLAIESDAGVFKPTGFGVVCSEKAMPYLKEIGTLLSPIRPAELKAGCRGADVLRLLEGGVPAMHLEIDRPKYFWYHHTEADTIDKLDLRQFQECVAYLADMPDDLPR
jgi:carboxypeptidase Q